MRSFHSSQLLVVKLFPPATSCVLGRVGCKIVLGSQSSLNADGLYTFMITFFLNYDLIILKITFLVYKGTRKFRDITGNIDFFNICSSVDKYEIVKYFLT